MLINLKKPTIIDINWQKLLSVKQSADASYNADMAQLGTKGLNCDVNNFLMSLLFSWFINFVGM